MSWTINIERFIKLYRNEQFNFINYNKIWKQTLGI